MNIVRRILDNGIHSKQDRYEKRLTRAVNLLTINAIVMIIFAGFFGMIVQKNASSFYIFFSIPFFMTAILLNWKGKTLAALSVIFLIGALLISLYSLRSGEESYTHINFILNIIGMAMLFNEGRARFFLVMNFVVTIVLFVFVFMSFQLDWFVGFEDKSIDAVYQRKLNLLVFVACTIVFSTVVVITNSRQKKALTQALEKHKVLLAEVNHRVKNNLSIIVSLIKLRREQITDAGTQQVLTEFFDQVMSMALIHQKMYEEKNISAIDVPTYVNDLLGEIKNSYAIGKSVEFRTVIGDIKMDVSRGVPFGLILNELITNSMKHAFESVAHPIILVSMKDVGSGKIVLTYSDNGVGSNVTDAETSGKLGMSLISSLCYQLDAEFRFFNNKGFSFEMTFFATSVAVS